MFPRCFPRLLSSRCSSFFSQPSYIQHRRFLMTIRDALNRISVEEIVQQQHQDHGFDQWESMLETNTVCDAIQRMVETNTRSLIVTTERNNIIGILTERDILKLNPENPTFLEAKIKDITTPQIMCADTSITALAALATMSGNNLNHLAIIDENVEAIEEEGDVVRKTSIPKQAMLSVISIKDILKYYYNKQGSNKIKEQMNDTKEASTSFKKTTAAMILREKHKLLKLILNTVVEDQIPVSEAIKAMIKNDCGSVVILDKDQNVQGIFTERDYTVKVLSKNVNPTTALVSKCGTSEPLCVYEGEDLKGCLEAVIQNDFQHFPVVDSNKQICGVLSLKDVAKMVAKEEKVRGFWLMEYFRQKLDAKKSTTHVENVTTTSTDPAKPAEKPNV